MNTRFTYLFTLMITITSAAINAADFTVHQQNKQFSERKMDIKIGDSINFVNADPFFHNVYSLSKMKEFDLGFYRKGLGKSVTFDKAGTVDVECAIHPNMKLTVVVKE